MRKIAVMTGTRADFGLLRPLLSELSARSDVELQLIVTGTHLSAAHGNTLEEVRASGFAPTAEIAIWSGEDSSLAAAIDTGEAVAKFSRALADLKPEIVVVLGDRLEAFAMATAATVLQIAVAHIHGGELTLGAMDDSLRHAITKLSYLHFTTTEGHRQRVEQLGESADRVFNFGAPILDILAEINFMSRDELASKFGVRFGDKTALMTFHPAAFDEAPAKFLIGELISAFEKSDGIHFIITGTNNDIGSDAVRAAIAQFVAANPERASYVESFGQLGYLSAMREVDVVVGNSSSTVLEAPVLGTPSVLVGNRQEGRPLSASVIKPAAKADEILHAILHALSPEFKADLAGVGTPFGEPGFAKKAAAELASHPIASPLKKKFREAH